jgi:hypothetical protein
LAPTIQRDKKVREKLKQLKIHPRESYNKVVERLIESRTEERELSEDTIRDVEKSLEDVRAGRTLSMTEVKRRLKMK